MWKIKKVELIKHHNKHVGNMPVTFVAHKHFVVLFFAPSFELTITRFKTGKHKMQV